MRLHSDFAHSCLLPAIIAGSLAKFQIPTLTYKGHCISGTVTSSANDATCRHLLLTKEEDEEHLPKFLVLKNIRSTCAHGKEQAGKKTGLMTNSSVMSHLLLTLDEKESFSLDAISSRINLLTRQLISSPTADPAKSNSNR